MLGSSISPPACAQRFPGLMASRMPGQDAAGCGEAQRSWPIGGAAYGIPWKSRASAVRVPRTAPASVGTTVLAVGVPRLFVAAPADPPETAAAELARIAAVSSAPSRRERPD